MEALQEKIDQIAKDTSYMSGQFDMIIPLLQKTADDHEKRIIEQEKKTENISGKASVIGAIIGFVSSAILSFFSNKF